MDFEKSSPVIAADARIPENPLSDRSTAQLIQLADDFCARNSIADDEDVRAFRLGAQMAGSDTLWETVAGLTDEERSVLKKEQESKWTNPKALYLVVVSTFISART